MRGSGWAFLLEDPDFRRWYENLRRGSEGTAAERARVLYRFVRIHDLTPQSLLELARKDRRGVEDLLADFVGRLEADGRAPGYIDNYLKAVRSWLDYNEVRLVRKIKLKNRGSTPSIEDERVPTRDELRDVLLYASERAKCSIAFVAFAGLRPETLGNVSGTDGLRVKDIPELRIEDGHIRFSKVPAMVVVRSTLSKARHRYFSFLSSEGCEILQAYLEKRLALPELLTPESPMIAVAPGFERMGKSPRNRGSRFISTKNVTRDIREAMRPRFKWRPYVLRAYFDTQLLVAENNGKISHAYRQFFMGHKGDMEARYTTNKGRLPDEMIEDMRRAIRDCEAYLSTRQPRSEEDPEVTTIKTMVESGVLDLSKQNVRTYLIQKLGIQDLEVKTAKMREKGLEEEEAAAQVLIGELGLDPIKIEAYRPRKEKNTKKIITERELEAHLVEGWDIYSMLPSGSIVVRKIRYE